MAGTDWRPVALYVIGLALFYAFYPTTILLGISGALLFRSRMASAGRARAQVLRRVFLGLLIIWLPEVLVWLYVVNTTHKLI